MGIRMQFLKKLFLGSGKTDLIPRQGWRRGWELIKEEWFRESSYGIVRLFRLLLHILSFASPTIHLDSFANWIRRKCSKKPDNESVDGRIVAIYREVFYLAQVLFLVAALKWEWHSVTWVALLSGYFIFAVMQSLLGITFAWGRYSIDPFRNFVLALISYAQVTLAFAVLYLHCNCLLMPLPDGASLRPIVGVRDAIYFSMVTAATVGYGEIAPQESGRVLVIWQITVSVLFALFLLTVLSSRLPIEKRPRFDISVE